MICMMQGAMPMGHITLVIVVLRYDFLKSLSDHTPCTLLYECIHIVPECIHTMMALQHTPRTLACAPHVPHYRSCVAQL